MDASNNENKPVHRSNALQGRNAALEHHLDQATHAQRAEYWREMYMAQKGRTTLIEDRNVALTKKVKSLREIRTKLEEKCGKLTRINYGSTIVHGFDMAKLRKELLEGKNGSVSHRGTQTRESYSSPSRVSRSRGRRFHRAPTPGPSSRREVTPPRVRQEEEPRSDPPVLVREDEPEPRRDEPIPRLRISVRDGHKKRGKHGRIDPRSKMCKCNLVFRTKVGLDRHVFEKCRGKIYCDYPSCRKWFSTVRDANRHKERRHPRQPNWACSGCSRFFWDKAELKQHKRENECKTTRIRTGAEYLSVREVDDEDFMRQEAEEHFDRFGTWE